MPLKNKLTLKMLKLNLAILFVAFCFININATVLRSKISQKNFFGDVAKGLVTTAVAPAAQQLLQQQLAQQQLLAQQQMAQQPMAQQQMAQQPMAQQLVPQDVVPTPAPVDIDKSANLDARQNLLAKQLAQQQEISEKLKKELDDLKKFGALEKPQGITAFQGIKAGSTTLPALGVTGSTTQLGETLPDEEAPIIFLEPPPLQPKDQLSVDREVECSLQRIGDTNSPAMKALRQYELHKLGKTAGGTLEEVQLEIKSTQANIAKKEGERNELFKQFKKKAREHVKTNSSKLKAEMTYANNDLKQKDKEISQLVSKLSRIKKKEAMMIRTQAPVKKALEEETEGQNEEELSED